MNDNYLFFDTPSACHENIFTYIENILDGLKIDINVSE